MKQKTDMKKEYRNKADKTFGMNTYKEMDQIERPNPRFPLRTDQSDKITKKKIEQGRIEDAEESMTQLADRIETNSFQG